MVSRITIAILAIATPCLDLCAAELEGKAFDRFLTEPLFGANVSVSDLKTKEVFQDQDTNQSGLFDFKDLREGKVEVRAKLEHYSFSTEIRDITAINKEQVEFAGI